MARNKLYFTYDVPTSITRVVNAVCADYERRERAIKYSAITGDTLDKYIELNAAVDRALEDVEVGLRKILLDDISSGRGYYKSSAVCLVSKNAYYCRRRKLIHDIATSLSLI